MSRLSRFRFVAAFVVALLLSLMCGQAAMAVPPVLPPVVFPVDTASIATEISAAGAIILLLAFTVTIAFALVRKLFRRVKHAV